MYIRHLNAMQFPDTVSERLLPQPYSHKAVVDDITVRRFADHFPVDQPFEGAVHAAGRPESVLKSPELISLTHPALAMALSNRILLAG